MSSDETASEIVLPFFLVSIESWMPLRMPVTTMTSSWFASVSAAASLASADCAYAALASIIVAEASATLSRLRFSCIPHSP